MHFLKNIGESIEFFDKNRGRNDCGGWQHWNTVWTKHLRCVAAFSLLSTAGQMSYFLPNTFVHASTCRRWPITSAWLIAVAVLWINTGLLNFFFGVTMVPWRTACPVRWDSGRSDSQQWFAWNLQVKALESMIEEMFIHYVIQPKKCLRFLPGVECI